MNKQTKILAPTTPPILIAITILFAPIPVKAKIAEGTTQIPQPLQNFETPFNGTLRLENSSFTIEDITVTAEFADAKILMHTSYGNRLESIQVDLTFKNCKATAPNFNMQFSFLEVHINAKNADANTVSYTAIATTTITIYQLLTGR